jgi:antitoxin (DNA-binding transcriptional repressor) of toxin-antitoxin stability system
MEMNATAFRKSLFQTLDRALEGEPVSVTYKGARLRLVPSKKTSKLARATKGDALMVDPDSIIGPQWEVLRLWEEKWAKRGKLD